MHSFTMNPTYVYTNVKIKSVLRILVIKSTIVFNGISHKHIKKQYFNHKVFF